MAEYIDREIFLKKVSDKEEVLWFNLLSMFNSSTERCISHGKRQAFTEFRHMVMDEPTTTDVVEVIRCKDRKYKAEAVLNRNGFLICPASGMEITDYDFCSYGERNNRGKNELF